MYIAAASSKIFESGQILWIRPDPTSLLPPPSHAPTRSPQMQGGVFFLVPASTSDPMHGKATAARLARQVVPEPRCVQQQAARRNAPCRGRAGGQGRRIDSSCA